jgi:energy-coupling factor transporter ATP-binding protein EcfA2
MDTRTRINPFPGLRPFMQEEADLFFGRDKQSDELVRRLASRRFLAVVGTSGSGKSSLVRAGLLPALEGGFMAEAGAYWRMAILRPQDDPIGFLARALVDTGVLAHLDLAPPAAEGVVETTLRRSSLGLVEVARLARLEPHENLLILVDQFEELFRFADLARQRGAGDEAPAFVKLLLEATRQTDVPVYVVITMRSDFLGDCARFRDLPEAISDSQYLIPRLTRDELQAVITGPIGVSGGRIAPALVQRLLNDIGDDMDQLPVLQHALMRAWDHWERSDADVRPIDLSDLKAIGGMAKALSRHADEAFESLVSERDRKIAERLFKCLTERGSDNRELRRPTPLARIAAIANVELDEVVAVIDVFRALGRSFLMPSHGVTLDDDSVIDISHESLIRQWGRLRTWVEEEAESRAMYLRLVEDTQLHRAGRTSLWGEPDLTYARQWQEREVPNVTWAERYGPGFEEASAFLRNSEAAHAAELERERQHAEVERLAQERELEQARALAEAQQQRADEQAAAHVKQRSLIIALVICLGFALAAAGFGWYQWDLAKNRQKMAESQELVAQENAKKAEEQAKLANERRVALQRAIAAVADPELRKTLTNEFLPESVKQLSQEEQQTKLIMEKERGSESGKATARTQGDGLKLWSTGSTLRVRFLDGDAAVQDKVMQIAQEWTKYANLRLEVSSAPDAEVRVSFKQPGVWSFIGTDALGVPRGQPTVNFGWLTGKTGDEEFGRAVLHEFGHVLGLIHEFQNPNADIPWNKDEVFRLMSGPPNFWSREAIEANLFSRPKGLRYREYDPESIMMLGAFSGVFFTRPFEIVDNSVLSESDKAFIRKLYPPL